MALKCLADFFKFGKRLGQMFFQLCNRLGGAHAGDYILALGIDKKFTVENFLSGCRIPGECHA